jgi:ABC-type Zn uptake system ZnuABC Zn-binding protein ZnuA
MEPMRAVKQLLGWLALFCGAVAGTAQISVVATTSIIGDVVRQVGGERIAVIVLIPPGMDPHAFEPTPRDIVTLTHAHVVFINGAGLEEMLAPVLEIAELRPKVVDLSAGLPLRTLAADDDHDHGGTDPHVWFDPFLVAEWTRTIETALAALDPGGKDTFASRAQAYREDLVALDRWIQDQVAAVPPEQRGLVTDHWVLGYFAARYGFTEAGAIVPGFSPLAEPSARELAALEDELRQLRVPAVFVSPWFSPGLATRLAQDTGVRIVILFHESLTGPDGPAPSYLELMRENVRRIVEALGG